MAILIRRYVHVFELGTGTEREPAAPKPQVEIMCARVWCSQSPTALEFGGVCPLWPPTSHAWEVAGW